MTLILGLLMLSVATAGPAAAQVPVRPTVGDTTWYFAEGYTGPGFDEYLTINNAGAAGTATITYYVEGQATPTERTINVPANSRTTVSVHLESGPTNPGGLGPLAVGHSTRVVATVPVIVERPMYFTYTGGGGSVGGGHNVVGTNDLHTTWSFAEGYTGPGFDEFLTIANPGTTAGTVTITYYVEGQSTPTTRTVAVSATSRTTVQVHNPQSASNPGGYGRTNPGQGISAKVESTVPIVVERPMYFTYTGADGTVGGGHNVMGVPAASAVCMALLRGAEEVPPVSTPAAGHVRLTIDALTGAIAGEWMIAGLTSSLTGAHIHEAPVGVNGPIRVSFSTGNTLPPTGGTFTTTSTAPTDLVGRILTNPADFYVNVHTTTNPGGEIRGQLSCTA